MGIQEQPGESASPAVIGLYPLASGSLLRPFQTDVIDITHVYVVFPVRAYSLRIWEIIETRNNRQRSLHGIVFRKSLPVCFLFSQRSATRLGRRRGSGWTGKKYHFLITKNKYLCYILFPLQRIKQARQFIISIHRALSAPVNCY